MVYPCHAMNYRDSYKLTHFYSSALMQHGSTDIPPHLQVMAAHCKKNHSSRMPLHIYQMNDQTMLSTKGSPAFSSVFFDRFRLVSAIWINVSKFPTDPILQEFILNHEIGHIKNRHHVKRLLEKKLDIIFAGTAGISFLSSYRSVANKGIILNTAIISGALSIIKIQLDKTDWYKSLLKWWHKKQENEAHEFAVTLSSNPAALREYLNQLSTEQC